MHPHTKYHWPISKDKNVMARTRKYYLKNNYLTLRSKVKVPRRSLRYATHHLMVMHPQHKLTYINKYNYNHCLINTILYYQFIYIFQLWCLHNVSIFNYVSPSDEGRHIVLVWFFLPLGPDKKILFKKQLFDLEVKGQGSTKVITVRDTPPYGHAPTYQISLTYLERQKCYGLLSEACPDHNLFVFPDRSIIFGMWVHDHKVMCRIP
jgi:hypothetical protein